MAAGTAPTVDSVPPLGGAHHIGLTVCDTHASEAWYRQTLGLERVIVEPHHGGSGYAVVLTRPGTPLFIGLDHHDANQGERFDECRTGLDHLAIAVAERQQLDCWAAHLDRLGVSRSEITERTDPFPNAVLVFRLHLTLPQDLAHTAVEAGWAEFHPLVTAGRLPPTHVMVYAPRDTEEMEVVTALVAASHRFATEGRDARPRR